MRNVEVKLRCDGATLARVRAQALELGALPVGTLRQVDTYFYAPHGRLKLRELATDGRPTEAVLIGYGRLDTPGARESTYEIAAAPDPAALRTALERTLGIRVRVAKVREVLLLRHTRIHLDDVEGLGGFVELETLVGEPDARRGPDARGAADGAAAEQELSAIAHSLGLRLAEGLAGSYADLLEPQRGDIRHDEGTAEDGV